MKVRELLNNPSHWTKEITAINANGGSVTASSVDACAWCLLGAIYRCYPSEIYPSILAKLYNHIGNFNKRPEETIIEYNDSPDTSHTDIINLLNKLDI